MADTPEGTEPPRRLPPRPPQPRPRRAARLMVGIAIMGFLTVGAAAAGGWFLFRDRFGSEVKDATWLEVPITASLDDSPTSDGLFFDPSSAPPLVTEVAAEIRRAAKDARITGLYLPIEEVGVGWAGTRELYDAVAAFRASGKPCATYADAYDNKTYYLATACGQIYVSPAGLLVANGFSITTEYYAGTFEKLGVHANFEHVGDYKSAVEPFVRTGPSDAASEAMNAMLDGLYGEMIAGIAQGRGISEDEARALVDDPPVTPDAALARKMVDGLKYRDEVEEGIAGKEHTKLKEYRQKSPPFSVGKRLAVLYAQGAIVSGESGSSFFGGQNIGDRSMVESLDDLREDEDVVAVVLRVNSPGGSGLASDNIWRAIRRLQEAKKPVVVSMGDYAASGGYYIAAPADWIVAEPATLTGSIGVFGGKINTAGVWEKLGVSMYTYQRGALASMFSPVSDFNDAERAKFREFLQSFYTIFVGRVAEGRKLEPANVEAIAQGRVWTGRQAMERGLVDELGGLDVAVTKARELAGVTEDDVTIERLPKRKNLFDRLMDDMEQTRMPVEASIPEVRHTYARLETLTRVLDDGVAALLPFTIDGR